MSYADEEQFKDTLKTKPKLSAALDRIYKKNPMSLTMFLRAKLKEYSKIERNKRKQIDKEDVFDEN